MTEKHTPTLQDIAADRDWWSADAGKHYRELAHGLRGIAANCRVQSALVYLIAVMVPTEAAITPS